LPVAGLGLVPDDGFTHGLTVVTCYEQTLFMSTGTRIWLVPVMLLTFAMTLPVQSDDKVTISKSRLEELERKEAELEKLKKEADKAESARQQLEGEQRRLKSEAVELKKAKEAAETRAAAAVAAAASVEPAIQHDTPAIATLPPLQKGEVVDAMDLMNHYRTDAAAAEKRYGAQPIRIKGEAVHFEKPSFVRDYFIYVRTTDSRWRVACRTYPPEKYSGLFTAKGGAEIVGMTGDGARFTLAKAGQQVMVEGRCKGIDGQTVKLVGCALISVQ
jgi:hypothetical protein